jgi:hypothetical protein
MRRLALAALALALLTTGCGSSRPTERAQLAAYIKQVNKIESALTAPLTAVTRAGAEFASERSAGVTSANNLLDAAHERTLLRAWRQIRTLRGRLAAVKPPQAALHLHKLLLALIDGQASLTRQVAKLIVFLPGFARALSPLDPATRRLESVLVRQRAPGPAAVSALFAAKAAALRQFRSVVDGVLIQLRRLQPPPVSKPGYDAQVSALGGMSTSAGRLADALAGGAPTNVAPLLVAFDRAATSNQTVAVQRAEIAAVRAYDAQSVKLETLSRQIERERLRLADTLK